MTKSEMTAKLLILASLNQAQNDVYMQITDETAYCKRNGGVTSGDDLTAEQNHCLKLICDCYCGGTDVIAIDKAVNYFLQKGYITE